MFYMKMKRSSYLKTLIFLTAPILVGNIHTTEGKELKCETVLNTDNIGQVLSLNLNSSPLWIKKNNGRYEVITVSPNGASCNLNMEQIVAEKEFIPLTKLGYYDDIYIEGSSPYFQVYFPVYNSFKGGKAIFDIEISPIAKEDSVIAVRVNDKVVKLIKVKDFGYTGKIEIPIQNFKNRKYSYQKNQ